MQDRFKFRCWDDIHREMIDLQEQDVNPYNISDIPQNNIMQCTGLKDNNGKLIFEGDIVARGEDKAVIKYDDETASFYMRWVETETFIEDCEVIGNIYENPELLEDK